MSNSTSPGAEALPSRQSVQSAGGNSAERGDSRLKMLFRLLFVLMSLIGIGVIFPGMFLAFSAPLGTLDLLQWAGVGCLAGAWGCLVYTLYRWSRRPARGTDVLRVVCCGLLGAGVGAAYCASRFNPTHELILEQYPWLVWLTAAVLAIGGAGLVLTMVAGRRRASSIPTPARAIRVPLSRRRFLLSLLAGLCVAWVLVQLLLLIDTGRYHLLLFWLASCGALVGLLVLRGRQASRYELKDPLGWRPWTLHLAGSFVVLLLWAVSVCTQERLFPTWVSQYLGALLLCVVLCNVFLGVELAELMVRTREHVRRGGATSPVLVVSPVLLRWFWVALGVCAVWLALAFLALLKTDLIVGSDLRVSVP